MCRNLGAYYVCYFYALYSNAMCVEGELIIALQKELIFIFHVNFLDNKRSPEKF
jgi:hypothetical protein